MIPDRDRTALAPVFWLAIGFAGALRTQLYGVSPLDPLTYLGVAALIVVAAVLAAALPALRATQIQPATALRFE